VRLHALRPDRSDKCKPPLRVPLSKLTGSEVRRLNYRVKRMKTYTVQANDTPMTIAHRFTGNRERYTELIAANPQKGLAALPRGLAGSPTFDSLHIGEKLNLPHSWGLGTPLQLHKDVIRNLRSAKASEITINCTWDCPPRPTEVNCTYTVCWGKDDGGGGQRKM